MNTLPELLKQQLLKTNARPKFFSDELKQMIFKWGEKWNYPTNNLIDDKLLSLWYRYIKSGITTIGICGYKGCTNHNRIVHRSDTNGFKVSNGCCMLHSLKITTLAKYGVENGMQSEVVKDKLKNTMLEKYGVENGMQSEVVKDKLKNTMLEKYGVENIFQSKKIKKQIQETILLKYGVSNPSQSKKIKDLKIKTNMTHYGVPNPMQSIDIRKKYELKFQVKYGVSNPMQLPEILEKNQKSAFTRKEYKWKTGEISLVQGYEPIVLKELEEQGYKFNEVLTDAKDMPKIIYQLDEKEHRYFPDIFIPKENLIIEVKSDYTLKADWDKNQAKFKATKSLGFDFRLEVR